MIEILKKYNFWNNKKIDLGYRRDFYLDKIDSYLGNKLIKVVLGQRRTGKSFIFRMIIDSLIKKNKINAKNILYINKDLQEFDFINDNKSLISVIDMYKKKMKVKGKVYLFIDEVQEIKNWEKSINSLSQDYTQEYEIFITGSNSNLLSSELSTYLSGRYVVIEVFPFSYQEYLGFYKLEKSKLTYISYLKKGGLPELYNIPDDLIVNYIKALKDSIVLRDIVQRHNIRDITLLNRLIDYIIDTQSTLFSPNKITNTFKSRGIKTNIETVSTYLSYLTEVFFIHESFRYDLKGKRILAGERKCYLNDLSFKHYLSSSFDKGISKYLENAIFLHYKREGYQIFTGKLDNKEIDFVIEKGSEKKYIQVAYLLTDENVIKREFGNLSLIKDSFDKIVITLDDINIGNIDGVKHISAWEL